METVNRLLAAAKLLALAVEAGLVAWPEDDQLVVKGPLDAEPIARQLLENKSLLLPMLKDRRFEIITCAGDDCAQAVLLIDGEGWCPAHKMTIKVIERACA